MGPSTTTDPARGLRLSLETVRQTSGFIEPVHARRATWLSLATLLRRAACPHLDIQPQELVAGVHGAAGQGPSPVYAFLADTLDNGAGYSTHLASSPEELEKYLQRVEEYVADLELPQHALECNASCYQCLRDYTNMTAHALLDWRLARDLLNILRGRNLDIDSEWHQKLLVSWAKDAAAEILLTDSGGAAIYTGGDWGDSEVVVVAKYPLEAADSLAGPRLRNLDAAVRGTRPGIQAIVFVDDFLLDRTPSAVTASVEAFSAKL
ncbi:Zn-binding domain-containing protein [Microbispora rosea]|uniref:Zn-binding domain-containing protein n=1 Tax=Microbispora rosea TaxID=58117 RepID=UPI00369C2738